MHKFVKNRGSLYEQDLCFLLHPRQPSNHMYKQLKAVCTMFTRFNLHRFFHAIITSMRRYTSVSHQYLIIKQQKPKRQSSSVVKGLSVVSNSRLGNLKRGGPFRRLRVISTNNIKSETRHDRRYESQIAAKKKRKEKTISSSPNPTRKKSK